MSKICKVIPIDRGNKESSWISIIEFPDDKVVLEGIRKDPLNNEGLLLQRIMFSKEAIEEIVPALQEWLKEKNK